jgi:hypothetical protein
MDDNQPKGLEERPKQIVAESDPLRQKQDQIIKRLAELSEKIERVRAKHRPISN